MNRRDFLKSFFSLIVGFLLILFSKNKTGRIDNRRTKFVVPTENKNEYLIGYRGTSYMDSGYFYAPYIPLVTTPVELDPDSFSPQKGVLTRYGKKMLQEGERFYGRVRLV